MCRSLSEYSRNVLLGKKVTVIYRDRSMDEVLEEFILLRQELNFIGNNFNQAVKKLNSMAGMPEAYVWQAMLEILRGQLEPAIGRIKDRIADYSDIWSQNILAGKG
jgi:hypothetical protein